MVSNTCNWDFSWRYSISVWNRSNIYNLLCVRFSPWKYRTSQCTFPYVIHCFFFPFFRTCSALCIRVLAVVLFSNLSLLSSFITCVSFCCWINWISVHNLHRRCAIQAREINCFPGRKTHICQTLNLNSTIQLFRVKGVTHPDRWIQYRAQSESGLRNHWRIRRSNHTQVRKSDVRSYKTFYMIISYDPIILYVFLFLKIS